MNLDIFGDRLIKSQILQVNRSPGRGSKPVSPEYEAGVVPKLTALRGVGLLLLYENITMTTVRVYQGT